MILLLLGKVSLLPIDKRVKKSQFIFFMVLFSNQLLFYFKIWIKWGTAGGQNIGIGCCEAFGKRHGRGSLGLTLLQRTLLDGLVSGRKWRAFVLHIHHHNVSAQVWSSVVWPRICLLQFHMLVVHWNNEKPTNSCHYKIFIDTTNAEIFL